MSQPVASYAPDPARSREREEPAEVDICRLGRMIEERFQKAAAEAVQRARKAGIPVAVLTDDQQIAWLHPDGVIRPSCDPVHS